MSANASIQPKSELKVIGNVHHAAYRCRDAEQTRWFYEDVLGLPLAAAMVFDHISGMEEKRDYMHLFFQLGDGNFIAFFDDPDTATENSFDRKDGFDVHLALEAASVEEMLAWQERINRCGKSCLGPIDHGFVKSVYMYDPNGLQVEITSKTPDYDAILAEDKAQVETQMASWTEKTRAGKIEKFGAEAVDKRGH
jgi:catechol 2,3-dioxygenase-like lactoylglutathione lyase family enzyme